MTMISTTGNFHRAWRAAATIGVLGTIAVASAVPAVAQYRQKVGNDMSRCATGAGPAVLVTVDGIKSSVGKIRVQSYNATAEEWMKKGHWLNRIELPARQGTMTFCLPIPKAGSYGIAIRHDANGNGETDIFSDGGGMSNNPKVNIFNLGKPNYKKTAIAVDNGVKSIRIVMRYM